MKNIKRALSLLIATMLALALPAETLAEELYIEYDAAPSQVESAVIETEESGQADIVQDEALAQAISDGETGENQTLSAAAARRSRISFSAFVSSAWPPPSSARCWRVICSRGRITGTSAGLRPTGC